MDDKKLIRQGDVLLISVVTLPNTIQLQTGPCIIAQGEVTGHAHQVKRGIL